MKSELIYNFSFIYYSGQDKNYLKFISDGNNF